MSAFHPDLAIARYVPKFSFGPRLARLMQKAKPRVPDAPDDVVIENVTVPGPGRRRAGVASGVPAAFSGGRGARAVLDPRRRLHQRVAGAGRGVEHRVRPRPAASRWSPCVYRLAPQHPAPAAVEDAYRRTALGVRPGRGARNRPDADRDRRGERRRRTRRRPRARTAHDKGEVAPAFQLLVYPMLDDRTVLRADMDTRNVRIWSPGSNRFGWTSYLGAEPGSHGVSHTRRPPAGRTSSGLPPAWIGVGTLDLFHDEDLAYAERLSASGVPCEVVTSFPALRTASTPSSARRTSRASSGGCRPRR